MAHILIIEDDEHFRPMLAQMLTQDNHRVRVACNGEEGMAMVMAEKPDLVITDVLMPKMDGIDFVMALSRQNTSIPVIAISGGRRAISAEFNLDSASLIGVQATLAKPFSRTDLRQAVEKALVG
ncbi:MAG TPA: response regulator [Rhodocyclaceae bacterium]|nr:response regulator [Rhodocyclaceae bacterium]